MYMHVLSSRMSRQRQGPAPAQALRAVAAPSSVVRIQAVAVCVQAGTLCEQAFRAVVDGLEEEVAAWRYACATGEGALGREVALLERESIPREAAEAIRQSAGRAKEALASERAKGGRLEAELLAGRVALRRKEEEVAALVEAGVRPAEDSAAAAVAVAAAAAAERKGRGLKLGLGSKGGSKKVEAIKNLSAELSSSKQMGRETKREMDGLLGQLAAASAANEDLDAQLRHEREALTQARAEAHDAAEAQRQAADRRVESEKEAALLTEQLQAFILQQKAVSERATATKAANPRKSTSGLISGFYRG